MLFSVSNLGIFDFLSAVFIFRAFFVLLLIFYIVFALIIFRQTQLMSKTLPTTLSPILMFIAILHLGIAVAFLFIVLGTF